MSPLASVLTFLAVITTVSTLAHVYVYRRLAHDPGFERPTKRLIGGVIAFLAILPMVGILAGRLGSREVAAPFVWAGMIWMGTLFFMLVSLFVLDLGKLVARIARRKPLDEDRRRFMSRVLAAVATAATMTLGARALYEGLARVRIERVRVPLAKLSTQMSGYKIVQLTDVHVGPTIGHDFIAEIVSQVNALAPDMVVITGDLVDGSVEELREHAAPLGEIRARDGVFFVTGNHEYYSGADEWLAHLVTLGIRPLRNERVAIGGVSGFDLAGVDDFRSKRFGKGHGADLPKALRGRDETRPVVLLAHQPKQVIEASRLGVDLQLSGHTHGGQLRPFDLFVHLDQPFVVGLEKLRETYVYVSKGTGYWGPPMRLGVPAEITEIELVRPV